MHIRVESNFSDDTLSGDLELQPGPRDPSVLYLQEKHRSTHVWNTGGGDSQRSRVRTKFPTLHSKIVPMLRDLRFDGVARLAGMNIDWGLITALVERWRPETHTFHLPIGECTITLQDVSILLGLRIDGNVVTGCTKPENGWDVIVKNMFGVAPNCMHLKGGRLKLNWLDNVVPKVLPDNADHDTLVRYTQAYILQLLGGVLFTDHQGCQVHCMFIPLLQDLNVCKELAWGAGVLAYLYRELCKSCKIGKEEITGCLLLLQLWAWTRLPTLAPVSSGPLLVNQEIWGDLPGPYGLRWCGRKTFGNVGSNALCVHRLSLDVLAPSHFIWMPYTNDVLETLDVYCREGSNIWCYKGPLVCFYIVEQHQPDRCVRQFGMLQDIPSPAVAYSSVLHNINLQGKIDVDWVKMHKDHISCWNDRLQHVHTVDSVGVGVTDGYDVWYGDITRPYHTRLAAAESYMIHVLDRISSIAKGDEIGGIRLIESLATHGRRLLEYQCSHGLVQNFSMDDRRAKEDALREKVKKVCQKGDCEGTSAEKRRRTGTDEEIIQQQPPKQGVQPQVVNQLVDEHVIQDEQQVANEVVVHPPTDFYPNFNLLSSSDEYTTPPQPQLNVEQEHSHIIQEQQQQPNVQQVSQQLPQQEQQMLEKEPQQRHMQLRPRNNEGIKCGTGGCKQYRRLRKKFQ